MSEQDSPRVALRATFMYVVIAGLYILFSDRLLATLASDSAQITRLQTAKGWGFVLLTALLIFLERRRAERQHARIETQLRRNQQRFSTIVQSMPILFDAFDEAGTIAMWNKECERVTGYRAEEIIHNSGAMELLYPDPAYRDRMLAEWAARGHDYRDWEWEITCRDGAKKIISWSNTSTETPIANWKTWGIGVDVTPRVRVEEALLRANRALKILSEINQIVVRSKDERDLLQEACRAIAAQDRYRFVVAACAGDDEQRSLRPVVQAGFENGGAETPNQIWSEQGRALAARAFRTGQPCVIRQVGSDPHHARWWDEAARWGFGSVAGLPLLVEEEIAGALVIYAAETDAFADEELSFLKELTADLGFGIGALRARAARDAAQTALHESQDHLRALLDSAQGFALYRLRVNQKDPKLSQVLVASSNLADLLGAVDPCDFSTWYQHVHEEDQARVADAQRRCLVGRSVFHETLRIFHRGRQQWRWISVRCAPASSDMGDLAYHDGIILDVTERYEAEFALQQREATLESILRVAPVGIGMSTNREMGFVNARFQNLLGYEAQELIGQNARMVYPDDETYREVMARQYPVIAGGQIGTTETIMRRKDGRLVDVRLSSAAIDPGDLSRGVIFTTMDITPLKQAERAQKLYTERLRILRAIDQAILGAQRTEEIVEAALSHILDLLPGAGAALVILDQQRKEAELVHVETHQAIEFFSGMRLPIVDAESTITRLKLGEFLLEEDLAARGNLPLLQEQLASRGIRSLLAVPVLAENQLFGILTVGAAQPAAYNPEDADLLAEVADQMAIALRQIQLREQVERHAIELEQRVAERTVELQRVVNLMAGREIRMSELKQGIARMKSQLLAAGIQPADDESPAPAGIGGDPIRGREALS